jgi:hypothetical protein
MTAFFYWLGLCTAIFISCFCWFFIFCIRRELYNSTVFAIRCWKAAASYYKEFELRKMPKWKYYLIQCHGFIHDWWIAIGADESTLHAPDRFVVYWPGKEPDDCPKGFEVFDPNNVKPRII